MSRKIKQSSRTLVSHLSVLFIAILSGGMLLPYAKARAAESVPGQFVIMTSEEGSALKIDGLQESLGVKIVSRIRDNMFLVQSVGEDQKAFQDLKQNPLVQIVEPNYIYRASKLPNDPGLEKLWGLRNVGLKDSKGTKGVTGVDIGVEKAWDIATGSKKIVVAVIDTGVDFKIPDLKNNAWTNEAEANGQPGVDDDGNGFVDDIHGYDFANNDADPTDDHGHGSHCSGTIGAEGNDGKGLVGVNWNVSIMAVKFLSSGGSGSLADAVKSIDYARKMGANVLSNSWGGGGPSEILRKAIEDTRDAGELFVAAAGNDSSDNDRRAAYPASYDIENIISVAAVDNRGELAYFSNWGLKSVHVAAPGVNILSTVPKGTDYYSGTSMATPHVSGVAALVWSAFPEMSNTELKTRLLSTARPLVTLEGKIITGGMIDAYYALTGSTPPQDPNDPSQWELSENLNLSTEHPYKANYSETYKVKIDGAKRISVHFSKFETEKTFDRVQFYNSAGESLGYWSGYQSGRFSPIAEGDTITLKFTSDSTQQAYGFDVDKVNFEKE